MVIFEISASASQLQEFIQVFGQRFLGLIDNQGIYADYRVPVPEAPYPQDYIIDQQGYVRYWSDEYDPQEIIRIIDELLGTEVEEHEQGLLQSNKINLIVAPNPFSKTTNISYTMPHHSENILLSIYDITGSLVKELSDPLPYALRASHEWSCTDQRGRKVPAGVYFVRLDTDEETVIKSVVVTK